MPIDRVGLFPTTDVNKDGKLDAILLQSGDFETKTRGKGGRWVTSFVHQTTLQPVLATDTEGIYRPFHGQDDCKTQEDLALIKAKTYRDQGIFWRFEDPSIPFAATLGAESFIVGQEVYVGDSKKPARIEYFRAAVLTRMGRMSVGPTEAVFKGCQATSIESLRSKAASSK